MTSEYVTGSGIAGTLSAVGSKTELVAGCMRPPPPAPAGFPGAGNFGNSQGHRKPPKRVHLIHKRVGETLRTIMAQPATRVRRPPY